jgi:NADH-quinone oxidoreductase subunit C
MNQALETLAEQISARFGDAVTRVASRCDELTFDVAPGSIVAVSRALHDEPQWSFEQLIDLCGVDYLQYGRTEWNTETATFRGFSRGVSRGTPGALALERGETPAAAMALDAAAADSLSRGAGERGGEDSGTLTRPAGDLSQHDGRAEDRQAAPGEEKRFAVVYHLLSVKTNRRLRLRVWCPPGEPPMIDSVIGVWKAADWFEREAFDLFGMLFRGHPDLRRLLTDYGFIGHPFRKDFPLTGNVEVRYDPTKRRVVYEPVTIEPRTLVPRVIREDNRYAPTLKDVPKHG